MYLQLKHAWSLRLFDRWVLSSLLEERVELWCESRQLNTRLSSRWRLSYLEQLIIAGLRFQLAALLDGFLELCGLLGRHVADVSRELINWLQTVLIEEQILVLMFRNLVEPRFESAKPPCT